jgi:hypothetical protein
MALHRSQLAALLLLGYSTAIGCRAQACDIPVFRYALERWPVAPYEVFVLHRGPLSASEQNAAGHLTVSAGELSPHVNIKIRVADLALSSGAPLIRIWEEAGRPELPCLILRYPRELRMDRPAWSGPLTAESARALVDSPARREISRRILAGHSAVWVLLTSGDADRDAAAHALLERSLKEVEQTLELPAPVAGTFAGQTSMPEAEAPPLQICFSFLSISATDPAESVLVGMLLRSEPDLSDYAAEPMAFPVYGRGRALYALVGRGLTEENISEACQFLAGPCSCEAKVLDPGTDLVMATDWDTALEGSAVQAVADQPLVGLATIAAAASGPRITEQTDDGAGAEPAPVLDESSPRSKAAPGSREAGAPVPAPANEAAALAPDRPAPNSPPPSGGLLPNLFVALGALLAVVLFLVIYAARRAAKERL